MKVASSACCGDRPTVLEELRDIRRDAVPGPAYPVKPSNETEADHHRHQGHRPRQRLEAAAGPTAACGGPPRARGSRPATGARQVEVDGEGLAAVEPALDAVERHPDEGDRGVHERRDREGLGLSPFEATSSIVANPKIPTAAGQRPSQAGYSSGAGSSLRHDRPRHPRHPPADGPPRVERAEDVPEHNAQRDQPQPEDHVDEDRRQVRRRALGAPQPRVDRQRRTGRSRSAPQAISTGRLAECAADAAGERAPARASAGAAGATALRAQRTRRRERSPRPTRTATPAPAGPSGPRCRGRSGTRAAQLGSTVSLPTSGSRPASSAMWLSISKIALDVRRELERRRLTRLDLLLDVVAVQVDVVGGVRVTTMRHPVALRHPDVRGPPTTSPPRISIRVTAGSGGARSRRFSVSSSVASVRLGASAVVVVVFTAVCRPRRPRPGCDHEGTHSHRAATISPMR